MSREEIQKLLGGYATGTLTAEEQRALYEAALTDQELFDAMAREEALREVLSDPASRAQLLAAIEEAPPKWYQRWWRPMVVMATAAGLIVTLMLYTRGPKLPEMAQVERPKFVPAAAPPSTPMLLRRRNCGRLHRRLISGDSAAGAEGAATGDARQGDGRSRLRGGRSTPGERSATAATAILPAIGRAGRGATTGRPIADAGSGAASQRHVRGEHRAIGRHGDRDRVERPYRGQRSQ